ncbi:hypothetical protein [Leptodesmis sichuanensis]|uniref:hypothetical protein n=1 Tax=Leptodesmis sichuanensis TaxID=2906798 RepID=UPI001F42D2C4|nr:hypothetical protein [Leptodesmis sichuanensis]UIE36146.1 hypothetical protein KIK02_13755 [Leptodesmis sichuanensis A121]
MTPDEIAQHLTNLFSNTVTELEPGSWQVEAPDFRLLVLLSDDRSWVRALAPIAAAQDAQPYLEQLLEANFDDTQQTHYALQEGALWGVFQHRCASLTPEDFEAALQRLQHLRHQGLDECFNRLVESRIRLIIQVAKLNGQSLETTLQTLDRFYEEGVMGEIDAGSEQKEQTLAAWRRQLERLWHEPGNETSGL